MRKFKIFLLSLAVLAVLSGCVGYEAAGLVEWDEKCALEIFQDAMSMISLPFDQAGRVDFTTYTEVKIEATEGVAFNNNHTSVVSDGIFWESTITSFSDATGEFVSIIRAENGEITETRTYINGRPFGDWMSGFTHISILHNYDEIPENQRNNIILSEIEFDGENAVVRMVFCGQAMTEDIRKAQEYNISQMPFQLAQQMLDFQITYGSTYITLILDAAARPLRFYTTTSHGTTVRGETTEHTSNSTTIVNYLH